MLHAIVMAGGAGTRFWPASRRLRPKQLLSLAGKRSMLQATVDRLGGLVPHERISVLTNRDLVAAVSHQLPQIQRDSILGEPCKRDTAPCLGLAAARLLRRDEEAVMLVAPADHVIPMEDQFHAAVHQATRLVDEESRRIVAFGIPPTYPSETFGYIERGERMGEDSKIFHVRLFREKPSAEVAEQYLAAGNFYWNSGIFVWKAKTILEALKTFEPEMYQRLQTIADSMETEAFSETLDREFAAIEGKSVDYAVMERYDNMAVIEVPFRWDDVGNWRSLARMRGSDEHGNSVEGRHLGVKTRGCIVRGEEDHLIVTVGLEDCIVVQTPDATLVARKHDEESIRTVVELIHEQGWDDYL
ncbi:MAG: mannose-1-phosphate guanylyltransferase [Pirellulaceae bacterium]